MDQVATMSGLKMVTEFGHLRTRSLYEGVFMGVHWGNSL